MITDHKNLIYFITIWKLTERQMRWVKELNKFNFIIAYHLKKKTQWNTLSRREQNMLKEFDDRYSHKKMWLLQLKMFEKKISKCFIMIANLTIANHENELISHDDSVAIDHFENFVAVNRLKFDTNQSKSSIDVLSCDDALLNQLESETVIDDLARFSDEVLKINLDYQILIKAVRDKKQWFNSKLDIKIFISKCDLNETERLHFRERKWVLNYESLKTDIIQRIHDSIMTRHSD